MYAFSIGRSSNSVRVIGESKQDLRKSSPEEGQYIKELQEVAVQKHAQAQQKPCLKPVPGVSVSIHPLVQQIAVENSKHSIASIDSRKLGLAFGE